jgi:hypothetical protein
VARGREIVVTENEVGSVVEQEPVEMEETKKRRRAATPSSSPGAGGAVYGLGMIGALVYFLRTAETREDYLLAVGKAVVWPAILVYLAFRRLGG